MPCSPPTNKPARSLRSTAIALSCAALTACGGGRGGRASTPDPTGAAKPPSVGPRPGQPNPGTSQPIKAVPPAPKPAEALEPEPVPPPASQTRTTRPRSCQARSRRESGQAGASLGRARAPACPRLTAPPFPHPRSSLLAPVSRQWPQSSARKAVPGQTASRPPGAIRCARRIHLFRDHPRRPSSVLRPGQSQTRTR